MLRKVHEGKWSSGQQIYHLRFTKGVVLSEKRTISM